MPKYFDKSVLLAVLLFTSCRTLNVSKNVGDNKPKTYSFSVDWFSNNIPIWQKALAPFKAQPDVKYLELGVYEGRSLIWMLENILTHPTAQVVAIDLFPENLLTTFRHNLEVAGAGNKVEVLKGKFSDILGKLPRKSFDIIYLDGGHMSWTTLETTILAWPLLKDNGLLIFDDYLSHKDWPEELTPKAAIDAFILSHRNFVDITGQGYQMFVRKIRNACQFPDNYGCTPLASWSYYWETKSLWNVAKKRELKLDPAQQAVIEGLIDKYHALAGATRFQHAVVSDRRFSKLIEELE